MKLLIIGHQNRIHKIKAVIKKHFSNIQTDSIEYSNPSQSSEIITVIKEEQKKVDGLLFTGTVPFKLINNGIIPSVPCDFIHRDNSSLIKVLLQATWTYGYDIQNLSFDTYEAEAIYKIYAEIGMCHVGKQLYIAEDRVLQGNYLEDLYAFHKKNYETHKVACCITALNNVYERLTADQIPCLILDPTTDVIKQTIERLQLKHIAHVNEQTKIVVMAISIDLPNEYSVVNENEYQLALDKMKISEEIYLYAQRLQAAVIQIDFSNYLVFCTKNTLETETDNYASIELLSSIKHKTNSTVSIGIGYGSTAREAKYSAILGIEKSKKNGKNTAYVVYNGKTVIGPINSSEKEEHADYVDEAFYLISQKSGVSINLIFKLHALINQYKKDTFTPIEMAEELKISLRNMNKILQKLENSGHIQIIGKKMMGAAGRPSRIIQLLF